MYPDKKVNPNSGVREFKPSRVEAASECCTTKVAPRCELDSALEQLAQAIESNTALVSALPSRFAFVLRPEGPSDCAKSCEEGYATPLANLLLNFARSIRVNNQTVSDVLDRCELPR